MTATKKLPPLHDIVRLLRPTHSEMVDGLERYSQDVGGFNYGPAQRCAPLAFSNSVPLTLLVAGCAVLRPKAARKPNTEVVRALYKYGTRRQIRTYSVGPKTLRLRKDVEVRISPTFAFVENDLASLFCLQPRRQFALSREQLGLYVSVFKWSYLVDDFEEVGLELLDLSVPDGCNERATKAYRLGDLPLVSRHEIERQFAAFLLAFDAAKMPARPSRSIRPPKDDGQLTFDA